MRNFDVVVIGASAGGVGSLQRLVEHVPANFPAAIFVTLHLPDGVRSMLPEILARAGNLPAALAINGEPIEPGRIYVAPAGFHLTLEPGRVRVTRGAREHAHRPAIDPLFRSAAVAYGPRAIGVILSGLLDDGTAGLIEMKRAGGTAVVQDPRDTEWPSMPQSAINHVKVDHVKPASQLGELLTQLLTDDDSPGGSREETEDLLAAEELKELTAYEDDADHPGKPSPYACPECGGVLWELNEGELLRFRCRVGHAYSTEALTTEQSLAAENALWTALRALEEQGAIRRRMAERARRHGHVRAAATYDERARDLDLQARQVRTLLLSGVGAAMPDPTPDPLPH
jgi:two-component system chemotaxis response regulator CheB